MSEASPEVRFVRALAAGVLRQEGGNAAAAAGSAALRDALAAQKSLVLEVQFTGFTRRGEAVGGVHPLLLRAAAQLIVLRVNRIGFTADAGEAELRELFGALSRPASQLPEDGLVGLLREKAPAGVYLSTSAGEVYRPAAPPGQAPPSTEASAAASPREDRAASTLDFVSGDSLVDLEAFELVETAPSRVPPPPDGEGESSPATPPPVREEPPADDLYHFFRAAPTGRGGEGEAEELVEALRAAQTVMRFDELTQSATRLVPRLLDSGREAEAIGLMEALAHEAERSDRSRVFRDSAAQALRRVATEQTLTGLAGLMERGVELRTRLLGLFLLIGGSAFAILEGITLRTGDAALREAAFRALLQADPMNVRLLERAMAEPVTARARTVLAVAMLPGVDSALSQRWLERGAGHPDAGIRVEVVRHATRLGTRGGMRILLDLLGDADESVRLAAVRGLGALAEPAAVPFLARVLNDSAEEEIQLEAVASLGRIGSPEALPVLTAVLNRRQLFAGKRLHRLKLAAVAALGGVPLPAARDVLTTVAAGRDGELAGEARRALAGG